MAQSPQPVPARPFAASSTPAKRGYFKESRQPIYSALLVLPFLLTYQAGLFVLRSDVINGGEAIIKQLGKPIVSHLGISGSLISLVIIVAAFFVWQFLRKGTWKVQWPVLVFTFFESLMYAVVLFMILRAFVHYASEEPRRASEDRRPSPTKHLATMREFPSKRMVASGDIPPRSDSRPVPNATRSNGESGTELRDFVLYCGAGVYEELVFRVILLGVLVLVLTRLMHMEHAYATAWAVMIGAIIFAAYHHIGASGDKFELNVFLQRLLCGLYFSALFYTRSFGVAAASHAMYDIVVGLNRIGS